MKINSRDLDRWITNEPQETNQQEEALEMKEYKNTQPEFFALWSMRQMQVELARLNQLLEDTITIAERIAK